MSRGFTRVSAPTLSALVVALTLALLASSAAASPLVSLRAGLSPLRLGASTSVSLGFRVAPDPRGEVPLLSSFSLRLPAGMGFAATTLGLATCPAATLLAQGAGACPHESLIGYGSARVQVAFGTQLVSEAARVSIFMTRPVERHTTALFYFDGRRPVISPLVLQSEVLTPSNSADSVLSTPVPPIPTAPDGPEVGMVALRTSIGPRRLRYFKQVGGRTVAYRPKGISIPETCPPGGFVFLADFQFRDGSRTAARSVVPCPPATARHDRTGGHG